MAVFLWFWFFFWTDEITNVVIKMKIQEHNFWKYLNAKDLYQQPAKHLKVFLKFQLVTASHLWRVCVFATNQWELSKLRKATCWDWCQVGANQCGQRWSIMAASIGLTTHSQWRMDRYWTCNWVLNIPRYGMSILDIKCPQCLPFRLF